MKIRVTDENWFLIAYKFKKNNIAILFYFCMKLNVKLGLIVYMYTVN